MALFPPSQEVMDQVRAEFGLDARRIQEAVILLNKWLLSQPHLPMEFEEERLERWILRCKNRLERTKSSIDMYYTLKNVVPELLVHRDPCTNWFKKTLNVGYALPLPKLTNDYNRVSLIGLFDPDPNNFDVLAVFKVIFMSFDVRMCEDYFSSDICIFDFSKIKVGHVLKFTLPLLKKLQVVLFKGFNFRMKKVYVINCPPYAESLVALAKSILRSKLAERVQIYSKHVSCLSEEISPKILPVEYGGENGCIRDHWYAWKKKMESYRDWFIEQDKYKSNERRRPGKAVDSGDLFGFEGSFRKLSVD